MNNHCKIIVETYTFPCSKRRQRLIRNTASDNKNQSFPTRLLCVLFSSSSATFPIVHCWEFWFFIFATHAHTSVAHVWSTDSILEPNVLLNGQSGQSIPLRVRFCLWWIASKCNGVIKQRNLLIGIACPYNRLQSLGQVGRETIIYNLINKQTNEYVGSQQWWKKHNGWRESGVPNLMVWRGSRVASILASLRCWVLCKALKSWGRRWYSYLEWVFFQVSIMWSTMKGDWAR